MSLTAGADEYDPPSRRDNNNPAPRTSQNKPQILEATMRNVPKLKELNYTQWKNVITNSIKKAKLWEYIDGSIQEPSEHDANSLTTYFDEAAAVRNAILGSLEVAAQRYIEEALDPRDAWRTLEKKYLTAEDDSDAKLASIEKQLADLRLEEGGDMIEHITEFCRMRSHLNGTRFALDDQSSITTLYRSLPPSYRQSVLTPDGAEMKDLNALCARLSYLSQNPEPQADASAPPVEDYTSWGVPADIKTFGLTGGKNPLLEQRAAVTCRDCLLKDHKAGTPECPQYEWRRELWGAEVEADSITASQAPVDSEVVRSSKKLTYEFSEPVKVVLSFSEMKLKKDLLKIMTDLKITIPSAIQQCAIIPMVSGRNVLAQAPKEDGKTTTLALSILQVIDANLPHAQALVLTPDKQEATKFRDTLWNLTRIGSTVPWAKCALCDDNAPIRAGLSQLAIERGDHIVLGTPDHVLELIRRRIFQTRHLKILAVDSIEQAIKAGFNDQILEIRRSSPCSLQTVAMLTNLSAELIQNTNDLMVDPLYITVDDKSVFFYARHFYVVLPDAQRMGRLNRLRHNLNASKIVVFLRDFEAREASS
ncbi:RNA helicase [Ceratobasidium sp. 423]|nr:RNA helicase [Ceratobasidium sp. 423]